MNLKLFCTICAAAALVGGAAANDLIDSEFKKASVYTENWMQILEPAFQPSGQVEATDGGVIFSANDKTPVMIRSIQKFPAASGDAFRFKAEVSGLTGGTWIYFRVITYRGNSYVGITQQRLNVRAPGEYEADLKVVAADGKPFTHAVFAFGVEKGGKLTLKELEIDTAEK